MGIGDSGERLGYIAATDGTPLYCICHEPRVLQKPPALIVPPLFEERKNAYALLRRLAAKLCDAGHPVLRFDYRGSGESGGSGAHRRWTHLAEDLQTARRALSDLSGCDDCILLGARLGATLALQSLLSAPENSRTPIIALAPVLAGATQVRLWKMRSKIRAELTAAAGNSEVAAGSQQANGSATLDFDGYAVDPDFFDDVAAIDLLKEARASGARVQLVQISHRTDIAPEFARLAESLGSQTSAMALRLEPFWEKLDDVDTLALENLVLQAAAQTA